MRRPGILLFLTAACALLFGIASYLASSKPPDPTTEQADDVIVPSILVSVCASFVFLFMLNAGNMCQDVFYRRAFRSFFGDLSGGAKAAALVYPDFELSGNVRLAIASLSPQEIYKKRANHYPGTRFIDVPNIVASNDLQAMITVATRLGRMLDDSPALLTDGSAVLDQERSMVSFGLTSNAVTDLYLKTDPDPLFLLEDPAGDPKIIVRHPGRPYAVYGRTDEIQHGIILRYRPDPEGDPDRFWFICAGLAAAGTPAAAWALAQKWKTYYRRFKKNDFIIIFKTSNDVHSYMHSTEVDFKERVRGPQHANRLQSA